MTDQELLREICQHQAEDSPRLAYADWLEEQPAVRVRCGKCKGTGGEMTSDKHGYMDYLTQCRNCDGGTVLDTSNADRAELIRVQCELAQQRKGMFTASPDNDKRQDWLEGRDKALRTAHPEWSKCLCPVCPPNRVVDGCPCGGSGDLFMPFGDGAVRRQITWDRGFIGSVSCRMDEVGEEQEEFCDGRSVMPVMQRKFVPTPWARAIVEQYPIQRFVVTDRAPTDNRYPLHGDDSGFGWFCGPGPSGTEYMMRHIIAPGVWELLNASPIWGGRWKLFPTRELALDALHVACADVVRKTVFGANH